MAVIINKEDDLNDSLTRRINADLRAKREASEQIEETHTDFTEDTDYLADTKKTGRFAWIWAVLIILAIISVIIIVTPIGG